MNPPLWPVAVLSGVLGLAIGSFLNVVIYRLPREESLLFPPSRCPHCETRIKARHNVPVLSWLVLRGRCAGCKDPISARYPLVEGGTAALFVALSLHFGVTAQLPAYLFLAAVGVALVMIDLDLRRLPDSIVLPAYLGGALLLMPAGAVDAAWWPAFRAAIGCITLATIYFTLALAYPDGATFADAKLAGLFGFFLGWLSWGAVLLGGLGGLFVAVAVSSLRTGLARRRQVSVTTALAPCLAVAACTALFVAQPLATWYGSLFGAS